jgi:NAD(P)-dependent dehydrogenase (short-subunit alcohol dehydrogenase family)
VPDQRGRVIIVTGANSGIGFETAAQLAGRGGTVVLACRDEGRATDAAARIVARTGTADVATVRLDLADLSSVRAAAAEIRSRCTQVDLLIANAGVSMPPAALSADGIEVQFATNHLGHFALVGLLLDRVTATAGSRIVTVTSVLHGLGRSRFDHVDHLDRANDRSRVSAYARSKLATTVFAIELQRRLAAAHAGTIALAAHPGSSSTDIARHIPRVERALAPVAGVLQQSPEMGALPILRAATDPGALGGEVYGPGGPFQWRGHPRPVRASRRAYDPALGQRLWALSERLSGVTVGA